MKHLKKIWMSQSARYIDATKPIVFWDTCALLDVLRIPYRSGSINELTMYEQILDSIKNGVIISVTSEIVAEEFDKHFSETCHNLENEQEKRKKGIKDFAAFETNVANKTRIFTAVDLLSIKQRLENVINDICKNTILIKGDAKQRRFADFRLRHSFAPAAKKNEYKDCYIWGMFITLAQKLPAHVSMTFFTSNKDDYYDKASNDVYSQLKDDCLAAGVNTDTKLSIGDLYGSLHNARYVH